jgi:hypothetical protein
MVVCKASCPYNTPDFICGNPLVTIDENGTCGQLWYKGQPRPPYHRELSEDKKEIIILEAEEQNED